jgi:hypothetical protein
MKARRILVPFGLAIGGLVIAAAMALLFGLIVMALWNWLMPEIFGLPTIAYWQAWGLVLLAHILFKSGRGNHSSRRPSSKWESKFKDRFKERFTGREVGPDDWPRHGPRRNSGPDPSAGEDDENGGDPDDVI